VARKTAAGDADVIARLADSGEKAVRRFVSFPLRMFIGAVDIAEAQIHKVAEALRNVDPLDERLVELEKRVESLEKQPPGRAPTAATSRPRTQRQSRPSEP
jgi:predicted metalloprotease